MIELAKKVLGLLLLVLCFMASGSSAEKAYSEVDAAYSGPAVESSGIAYVQEDNGRDVYRILGEKFKEIYTAAQKQAEEKIVVSFAGDCTLGTDESFSYVNSFPYRFEKENKDFGYFFRGVNKVFKEDDLSLVNLETTFTTATQKAQKTFRFKGDPSYAGILREGGIEMVNISNNHIYDYLDRGFEDTLKALKEAGILYSGEGNRGEYNVRGIRIASLGYTGWDTSVKKRVLSDIERVRGNTDILIVSFHWGEEGSFYANEVQTELGRLSIDAGADIVVGHHPHVVQGIERYKDKYIVYSLGNFCFGGNRNPADKDTFIFQCSFTFQDGKLLKNEGRIIPCRISSTDSLNDYQPALLTGTEAERVLERIYSYSGKLKYGIKKEQGQD